MVRNNPTLSIVVPHLNQPDFLARCLASLHNQTTDISDVEIIIVDNGSRELPTDICAAYSNVKLMSEATPGPGPARNAGIAAATADNLAFIDADCIAHPDWIVAVKTAFDDPQIDVFGGDVRIAIEDPAKWTALEAYESVYAYRQKEYIEKHGFSGTGNLAMRRAIHQKVGPFAGIGVAEDREWGQRATKLGLLIRYVPDMIAYHPARKTMDELQRKWDRHTAHDFEEQVNGPLSYGKWIIKALALAASPLWEGFRIASSDRIERMANTPKALGVLTSIRWYRATKMLQRAFSGRKSGVTSASWNRPDPQ